MGTQGWIVLAIAALAAAAGLRKLVRTLAHRGRDAGCCCDGSCGRPRVRTGKDAAGRHQE